MWPAVVAATQIWSVRDPSKFAALRPRLAVAHPDLDDLCDDHTSGFVEFCARSGKAHRVIEAAVHDTVDRALAAFKPAPYVTPSSGMIVIADVLARFADSRVLLAGFGHTGWDGHPFAAERELVESYVAGGRVRRPP